MNARYEKLERLGGGGMGVVYRARQIKDVWDREVALKYMKDPPDEELRTTYALAFVNEARLCAQLAHKNVVRLLDSGEDDEGRFLVFELVRGAFDGGADMKSVIKQRGALPPELAAYVAREVLRGLAYAHAWMNEDGEPAPVVHRDISPDNILVDSEGAVRIADFGIARMYEGPEATKSNVFAGKLAYASPERLRFESLDGRSDVFGVGIVLHEMLTGRRLFGYGEDGKRKSDRQVCRDVLEATIPNPHDLRPEVPAALAAVCMRMLERDVRTRPTAAGAADAIEATRLLDGVSDERLKVWLRTQDATRRIGIAVAEEGAATNDEAPAMAMRSASSALAPPTAGDDVSWIVKATTFGLGLVVVVLLATLIARRMGEGDPPRVIAPRGSSPSAAHEKASAKDAGEAEVLVRDEVALPTDGGPRDGGEPRREAKSTRRVDRSKRSEPPEAPPGSTKRDGGVPPMDRLFPAGFELPAKRDAGAKPALDPDALFPEGYDPGR